MAKVTDAEFSEKFDVKMSDVSSYTCENRDELQEEGGLLVTHYQRDDDEINQNIKANILGSMNSRSVKEEGNAGEHPVCDETNKDVPSPISVDISPENDGGVMKQILREGTGDATPGFGDKVIVHYVGWLLNGKHTSVFDSSRERGDKFEFYLGKGLVIKAWDIGLTTMKRGEISVFICSPKYAYGEFGSPPAIPPMSSLAFEIELFDWKLEDLSFKKDGGILREVIVKGEGANSPNDGASVTAQIIGYCCDDIFDDRVVEFNLGEGCNKEVPEGIEVALQKFKIQEKSRLYLKSKYAFGSCGKPEYSIPPDADVVYDLTLLKFEKAKEVWEMDTDEKLLKSLEAKDKGSSYFKIGNLKVALRQFKRIIKYLENEPGVSLDEQKPRSDLLLAGYLNCALCLLKLETPMEAVKICEKALEIDPDNEKALFRRGQGLIALNEFEQALGDFQKTLSLYPTNKAAENSVISCQKRIERHKEKERKTYSNMFKKFADEDEELRKQMLFQTETGVWGGDNSDHSNHKELEGLTESTKIEGYREIELLNDRNLREIEMLNIHSNRERHNQVDVLNEHNKQEMLEIEMLNEPNFQDLKKIKEHDVHERHTETEVLNECNKIALVETNENNKCSNEAVYQCNESKHEVYDHSKIDLKDAKKHNEHHSCSETKLLLECRTSEESSGIGIINKHNMCKFQGASLCNRHEEPSDLHKHNKCNNLEYYSSSDEPGRHSHPEEIEHADSKESEYNENDGLTELEKFDNKVMEPNDYSDVMECTAKTDSE